MQLSKFIISGFSDEISQDTTEQFEHIKSLGISYFEPRGIDGKNISEISLEEAQKLKNKMDSFGIKASSIGSPIGKIKINDDFEKHMKLLNHVMDVADVLGTKFIRVFSFYVDGVYEESREAVISRMKEMTALAEKRDFVLLHENEKGIYGDIALRCAEIMKEVNSTNLRAVFDPANFVQCGQKTFPDAFEMLRPYVVYMHIKDAVESGDVVPAGYGIGCVGEIINELDKMNYEGFLSLEPHLGSFAGLAALEEDDKMLSLEASSPEKYTLAYESLKKLLK